MSDFSKPEANVVQVQQTVTGMEQCIAAGAGLITAGPLGAAAAWTVLKGVQGKWAPWTVTGFVAAPILAFVQLAMITAVSATELPASYQPTFETERVENVRSL